MIYKPQTIKFLDTCTKLLPSLTGVPDFFIKGHLDTVCCDIKRPFKGKLVVVKSAISIRSIELQLVRVETCGCAEGYAREGNTIIRTK